MNASSFDASVIVPVGLLGLQSQISLVLSVIFAQTDPGQTDSRQSTEFQSLWHPLIWKPHDTTGTTAWQ